LEVILETQGAGGISLVGGSLALDFANTAGGRFLAESSEHLLAPADVIDWSLHAGAADAATAQRAGAVIAKDSEEGGKLLRHAVQLREAIHRAGMAIAHGEGAATADLDIVKDFARKAIAAAALVPTASAGYAFDFSGAPTEFALLGPVAWSAIELLQHGRLDRLKECPGDDCGWLFIDTSKNGSRRWCDMATCGNRSKVNRHRHRH
jgi:predicted RNA-binding Zn ribbon-like protein